MKRLALFWVLLLGSMGAFGATPMRVLILEEPRVRALPPAQSTAIAHAVRLRLSQTGEYYLPTPEEIELRNIQKDSLFSYPDSTSLWNLQWSLEGRDSLLWISLHLRGPAPANSRHRQLRLAKALSPANMALEIAKRLQSADSVHSADYQQEPTRLWWTGLLWTGFATVAWQQDAFNSSDPNDASLVAQAPSRAANGEAGFFSGLPPHPALRALGGAGSARDGTPAVQVLNPAGLVHSKLQADLAAGSLPGGASEIVASLTAPCGYGFWQGQSLRFEGDSLARSWLFASSLALDIGYWFPWLEGVRSGLSLKGSSLELGQPHSVSTVTGNALGWGMDWGIQWQVTPAISMGASWLDAFAATHYFNTLTDRDYYERTPHRWIWALAWQAPLQTLLLADWESGSGDYGHDFISLGVEKSLWHGLIWRGGYRKMNGTTQATWHTGIEAGIQTAGIGLKLIYALEAPSEPGSWTRTRQSIGTSMFF